MKRMYNVITITLRVLVAVMVAAVFQCSDPDFTYSTTDDVVITGYFEKNQDQFSEFLEILRLSGNSAFLGAYGTYTCFAPTNDAIAKYLQERGLTTVSEIPAAEMKDFVRFHVIADTLSTAKFTDGKLEQPTMYGQYLITGAVNIEGTSFIRVNRQGNILKSNIRAANGLIHVIDNVLKPASLTIAQLIEQDPEYSIFTQALKETGFYAMLNTVENNPDGTRKWYTVIAQTDQVFKEAGFDTYEKVKARYSHLGDPANTADSLHLFVAYRILPGIKYLTDLITAPSHSTVAPLEVVTTRLEGLDVLVNSDLFKGVREPGSMLHRERSDYSATNGVLHAVLTNFTIKVRTPYAVYFDVTDQPELRRMTNDFRKPGRSVILSNGMLSDVTWGGSATIKYATIGATSQDPYIYGDFFEMNVRTAVVPWIEFTTPLLVKGKYKVWVCYRVRAYNDFQSFFNDKPLPRVWGLNPAVYYPSSLSPDDAEAQGWKRYTTHETNNNFVGRLLGTIEVETTDRHKFKIVGLTNRGGKTGNPMWFDMVQFIPVEQLDQKWPRIEKDGTLVDKP